MAGINESLALVMADCTAVAKRDRNEHQKFLFRGVDAVVNAVGPILRKHQVVVMPQVRDVHYDVVQTTTGKPATACRVLVDYVFSATDGSTLTATVAAEAWDSGDKAAPKAMSIAFRTALLQALALPTDDPEPDGQTFQRDAAPAATRPAPRPAASGGQIKAATRGRMFALLGELNLTDDEQRDRMGVVLGRVVESRASLTEDEAQRVIRALEARKEREKLAAAIVPDPEPALDDPTLDEGWQQ